MPRTSLIRTPYFLFTIGSVCLLGVGALCCLPGTDFASAFIAEMFEAGTWFAICAVLYFLLRHRLNLLLGELHFWLTAAAVLIGFVLPYWLSPHHGHPGRFLFDELEDNLRLFLFFFAVQALLVANLLWTLLNSLFGSGAVKQQPSRD